MEEIIKTAFVESFQYLCRQVNEDTFRHINESVYRYMFIRHLPESIGIEDEWHRIDLLLHDSSDFQYPIEFKQYDTRPLFSIGEAKKRKKGGAGQKNFDEFIKSAKNLVGWKDKHKDLYREERCNFKKSYFVLVAGDNDDVEGKKRFDNWYWDQDYLRERLEEKGIRSKIIVQKECEKSSLKIFGWVIEVSQITNS